MIRRPLAVAAVTAAAASWLVRSELHRRRERRWAQTALSSALARLSPGELPLSVTVTVRGEDGRRAAYTAKQGDKGIEVSVRKPEAPRAR